MELDKVTTGVDEAGRGPLAGPVVAAAVVLPRSCVIQNLTDSKKLSSFQRQEVFEEIRTKAVSWSVAVAQVHEIDAFNVLQASMIAMRRAVRGLLISPGEVLVDGNQDPRLGCYVRTIVRGDETEPSISAASIVAKVYRDRLMDKLETQYPGYGLSKNKGYPTRAHLCALRERGPSAAHRYSFEPVRFAAVEHKD